MHWSGSSFSASPSTPRGYTAPNYNSKSGGSLYAFKSNGDGGGTYVDSYGRKRSY